MKMTELQFRLIKENLKVLTSKPCFYKEKFKDIDIDAIKSQEDFEKLPFTWKGDLRDAYPLGLQAEPDEEIVRIHSSSGTTGTPVIIPYTQKDVDDWAKMFARCYEMAGITALDRIQITPGYGLWTAGIGFQLGAEQFLEEFQRENTCILAFEGEINEFFSGTDKFSRGFLHARGEEALVVVCQQVKAAVSKEIVESGTQTGGVLAGLEGLLVVRC